MASSSDNENQVQTAVECDTCENTAKHLCKTCDDRLCDSCKIIHSKSKATFDHDVVFLTYEALTFSSECHSYHVCKWHAKFRVSVGCQKCEVPVCEKCLIGEHNGHNLMDINELFRYKENKLEQKLSLIRSELPKYESRLDEVRKKQKEIMENKEAVKKEIVCHFEQLSSALESCKEKFISSADERAMANLSTLNDQESILQTCIQNMQEYMSNFQNEDSRERMAFICYAICAVDVTIPEVCPLLLDPGRLKFKEERFSEKLSQTFIGNILKSTDNVKLLDKEMVQITKTVALVEEPIATLAYCPAPEMFWIYSAKHFRSYDVEGNFLDKIAANICRTRNKPICVADNYDILFYRKDSSEIFSSEDSHEKLFKDLAPMVVVCLCSTSDGDILVGLQHSTQKNFAVARFSLNGERKQYITHLIKKWTTEPFLLSDSIRAYIVQNINGDICLSVDTTTTQAVILIYPSGDHKITYKGEGSCISQPFLPRGICADVLGHILVADENNHGVHILDKDGGFLTMLTIPSEPQTVPISLCRDIQDNLCVGCADGKLRILKYLD